MNDSRSPSASLKPISGKADQASFAFAVMGGMLSGVAIKFWPSQTTANDSVGLTPILWIFTGAGPGILGFAGVMSPALLLLVRAQTPSRFGLIAVGLAITAIGILTLMKRQAVPTPDHNP